MSAGLHRVLHSGHQDQRLVGPAAPWYVKPVEKTGRYTTQWRRVEFDTTPAYGIKATATIPVAGELITRAYIVATLPSFSTGLAQARAQAIAAGETFIGPTIGYTNSIGHALLRQVSLTIGNTAFDTLDSRLLETIDEFDTPLEKVPLINTMISRADNGFYAGLYGGTDPQPVVVTVPLPFWCFKGDIKTALPVDALNASRVQIAADFRPLTEMVVSDNIPYTETGSAIAAAEAYTGTAPQVTIDPNTLNFYSQNVGAGTYSLINGIDFGSLRLGTTYIMVEYVYLDKLEAAAWRNGNIQYPITQHRAFPIVQTAGSHTVVIDLPFNNPVRFLYFSLQRTDAATYNMHFQAARNIYRYNDISAGLWWPDASGLTYDAPGFLRPGYSSLESEPLQSIELTYEGKYVKVRTENPALYRSLLPALEKTKTPWVNRYYYCIPLSLGPEPETKSDAVGEVNWNKITTKTLTLTLAKPFGTDVMRNYNVYVHVESCNVFNIYGGTGSLLFDY